MSPGFHGDHGRETVLRKIALGIRGSRAALREEARYRQAVAAAGPPPTESDTG